MAEPFESHFLCGADTSAFVRYRDIEFAIRARPGRNHWTWTILAEGKSPIAVSFYGTRDEAVMAACRGIDNWLTKRRIDNKNHGSGAPNAQAGA